jgi:hypothetical protein
MPVAQVHFICRANDILKKLLRSKIESFLVTKKSARGNAVRCCGRLVPSQQLWHLFGGWRRIERIALFCWCYHRMEPLYRQYAKRREGNQ